MDLKLFTLVFTLLPLIGCGNENEGDVNLGNINTIEIKTLFDFESTGFDSEGNEVSASIRLVNERESFDGVATYIIRTLTIHGSDIEENFDLIKTSSLSQKSDLLGYIKNTGETCLNPIPDRLPDFVSAGDSGVLSTLDCLGIFIEKRNWFAEATIEGGVKVTINSEEIPRRSGMYITSMSYLVSDQSEITGFEIEFYRSRYKLDGNNNPIIDSEVLYSLKSIDG